MQNVLIVDDEKIFLTSLSEGLSLYAGEFNVLTAHDGKEAAEILGMVPVQLVVTDLNMPGMDGFELLAHMSRNNPGVPALVMTAFGGPEVDERLRALSINEYIEKPVDYKALANRILDELSASSIGHINGITLATFLQLIEMEHKTCTLEIASADKAGRLYFAKGVLVEAETGDRAGDDAAYDILCWDKVEIEISPACKKKKHITLPLNHLLMEAFRLKDERGKEAGRSEDVLVDDVELDWGDVKDERGEQEIENNFMKEVVMSMESHFQALREIKGYKAAGIMNFTGEMLASDSSDPSIDLEMVGATFNDIFRAAHEASKKIGLDACRETVISTPKGIIVMRCTGTDSKAHLHVIGIMSHDGNQALMKMQIEKMVPVVMDEAA